MKPFAQIRSANANVASLLLVHFPISLQRFFQNWKLSMRMRKKQMRCAVKAVHRSLADVAAAFSLRVIPNQSTAAVTAGGAWWLHYANTVSRIYSLKRYVGCAATYKQRITPKPPIAKLIVRWVNQVKWSYLSCIKDYNIPYPRAYDSKSIANPSQRNINKIGISFPSMRLLFSFAISSPQAFSRLLYHQESNKLLRGISALIQRQQNKEIIAARPTMKKTFAPLREIISLWSC